MQAGQAGALQVCSAYWSAAVHDFEHGGVNNDFLIKTAHPLAITYNDQSPLENHHLAAATLEVLKPEHLYTPVSLSRLHHVCPCIHLSVCAALAGRAFLSPKGLSHVCLSASVSVQLSPQCHLLTCKSA